MEKRANIFVRSVRDYPIGWAVAWFLFTVFPAILAVWHDLASQNSLLHALLGWLEAVMPSTALANFSSLYLLWFTVPIGLVMMAYVIYLVRTQPTYTINQTEPPESETDPSTTEEVGGEEEVVGLFDLFMRAEAASENIVQITNEITDATNSFNSNIKQRSAELDSLDAEGRELIVQAKTIVSETAQEVNAYADEIDKRVEPLGNNLNKALDAWSQAATIWDEDFGGDIDEIVDARDTAAELESNLTTAEESVGELAEVLSSWPRISKELIHAKTRASKVLKDLQERLAAGRSRTNKIVSQFDDIIERHESDATNFD